MDAHRLLAWHGSYNVGRGPAVPRASEALFFVRIVINASGSDELMPLTNSSATYFGHEGPTCDMPGTCNIESIRRPAMWDGLHASGPERCVRTGQATAHAAARWEMLRSSCSATAAPLAIDL